MVSKKLFANAETATAFLTVMGNEKRLLIMNYLADGELSVGVLAEKVELSQSALSQHLAKLRGFGLVDTRRDRQMIYYSCKSAAARELLSLLDGLLLEDLLATGPRWRSDRDVAEGQRRPQAA
ncbi:MULTISPECIES: metalloregulator ArsR/SmtB family transcription factor [unclassified Mesorhizobium]|uniref:ArsR/SmtB family transcription factor n=1 Tax=unclassified Mesorhizobium TaxID=325217 RepID=UPI000FD7490C|nr:MULTISPECIES: metalloregulator ArsR/SmtB family transcription factor [unclassified Mesorhizobium]TGQ31241.1 ArsR family transcriptional regulator [Mesorhizobium sp. M00.F.Ca.ET.216.01.1.1]TIS53717.1 MAG: metalloregulator ArsR/SmtB family transcription factor [Mesorhizobium sp.]TIS85979.1 MAG: metalloregulator ArsR/SmtB family transcription factor [Mesorhizobium sp.]TJW09383.1 MAG: metalloregulator ArsR/SmtB family transcription factor [Mesorhizobium sp.]TJW34498.1 MAG: metalloregulator ArsR